LVFAGGDLCFHTCCVGNEEAYPKVLHHAEKPYIFS